MLEQGHGKIVNMGSHIGVCGDANWAASSAAKGGVITLSTTLAWEWAAHRDRERAGPRPIYTDMNERLFDVPEIRSAVEAKVPLGRIGQPDQLGPAAVVLAGPARTT